MAVNDYLRECKYNLNNLDNYIYLYEFDEPILNYITDDEESNGSSINLNGSSYRLYCENVQYSSTSSVDNRFSFDNTLTVTLAESKEVTHYTIIQTLLTNNWMVVFKNTDGDAFVVNAEFPVMVSYNYVFNDEKTPNLLTITFRALQNVPTINYRGSVAFSSTLRDKPCEYSISRIQSLKMIDMNKADIDVEGDGFNITEKGEGQLKTIEFNPTSLSFTDSYDGREFSQQLSFQIPFDSYRFYFHYNLLEYLDNRYYALIKTTNNNNILGGFRQGLFPSYTVSTSDSGNLITINLNAKYTTYSVLGSDTMSITTNDGFSYTPVLGECVNNIYTWTLIEQINSNGVPTNGYYCLNGFEDVYSDYTILGTYNQFDTTFGFKLTDFNIDCSEGCKINNLPSSIQFQTSGETQCFDLDATCSIVWEWNAEAITVNWDELTQQLCVTSIVDDGTFSIKGTLSDGTIQYATVVIGSGGITGDTTTTINITAQAQKVSVIPVKGLNNVKSITSTLQYVTNENNNGYNVSVDENPNEEPRTFTITIIYNDNSIETINIIQDRIYYKIVSSEETECFGNDLYYVNKRYKGYKETDINILVENLKGNVKENDSESCFEYDEKVSACTACFEGYIYTLYEYKKDDVVVVTKYEKTTETCTNNGSTQYQINTGKTICVDDKPYYKDDLFGLSCKDNSTYIRLYPNIEQVSETEAPDSNACDVINPDNPDGTVLYRWVDTNETYCLTDGQDTNCTSSTTTTYCDGYNLYEQTTYYVDVLCNGNFVQSGSPINTLIETNSTECGYEEDTGTTCTSSTTYNNFTCISITLDDGTVVTPINSNEYYTNKTVAWNEVYDGVVSVSYTKDKTVINTDCTSATTTETFTTTNFTYVYSPSGNNETTEDREVFANMFENGMSFIGRIYYTQEGKPSDTSGSTSGNTSGDTSGCGDAVTIGNNLSVDFTADSYIAVSGVSTSGTNKYLVLNATTATSTNNGDGTYTYTISKDELMTSKSLSSIYFINYGGTDTIVKVNEIISNVPVMFYNNDGITELNISNSIILETGGENGSFEEMSNLECLNVSNCSINGTSMKNMFADCYLLSNFNGYNLNTSNVNNMESLFIRNYALTSLDLSSWNVSNVTNMKSLFNQCSSLTTLNLSNWNMSNVIDTTYMFNNCSSLTTIYCYNCNQTTIDLLNSIKPTNCTLVY